METGTTSSQPRVGGIFATVLSAVTISQSKYEFSPPHSHIERHPMKFARILLCLCLVFFVACSSSDKKDNKNGDKTGENKTGEKNDGKTTVVIGGSGNKTGAKGVPFNSNRPDWTQKSTYLGETGIIGVGRGSASNVDVARAQAINQAKSSLASYKEVQVKSIAQSYSESMSQADSENLFNQTREIINAESSQRLRFTTVLDNPYIETLDGQINYFARVSIPKDKLFPEERIKSLFATKQGSRERIEALIKLAQDYETEGFDSNAEAAYRRAATERGSKPDDTLALVRFLINKRSDYVNANRFLDSIKQEILKLPESGETRKYWTRLKVLVNKSVPKVNASISQLQSLASRGEDKKRFEASIGESTRSSDGTSINVVLTIKGPSRRVLGLWVDKETFSIMPVGNDQNFRGTRVLSVALEKTSKGGALIVWALPDDSPVWDTVATLKNINIDRETKKREDQLKVWSLQTQLAKALDTNAATPGASGFVRLTP